MDNSWVILNRSYKSVGFNANYFIFYENFPVSVKLPDLGEENIKNLCYSGDLDGNRIYLYNDGCVPTHSAKNMSVYLEKLELLASITVIRE